MIPHSSLDDPSAPTGDGTPAAVNLSALVRFRPGLEHYFRRQGFGSDDAADLAQETLVRAYQFRSSFRGGQLHSWLYRIGANLATDTRRKGRLRCVDVAAAEERVCPEAGPEAALLKSEQRAQVRAAMQKLPQRQQDLIRWRYEQDLSPTEIAGRLRVSPLAVRTRLFRAMNGLRRSLIPQL